MQPLLLKKMKKIITTSLFFCSLLVSCGPSTQEAAKADIGSENNETFLQPQAEVQRQKEKDEQNLYKQELIDLRAQLVLETEKLKKISNNQEITEQIKLIDSIKAETDKVSEMVK
jgi:hypothetical protein